MMAPKRDFVQRIKDWEKVVDREETNEEVLPPEERKEKYESCVGQLTEKKQRKWLYQRGKGHTLAFSDEMLRKLKECFLALDDDGSGAIGIDELEEPLIGLGFANTRQEVDDLIKAVDDDGQIEFAEFLQIIKGSDGSVNE